MIHIVIPIYNAYDALKNCLKSVQKYNNSNVTLINDASTDARIAPLLEEYAEKNNWQIIEHNINKGFVVTANEGLQLTKDNTILLNSDTVVSKYWLEAFEQALNANSNLGTITAWSNNAEICSFPEFLVNNKVYENIDKLSEILYEHYIPQYPLLPTAVGFCMLITQVAQDKVGLLDEQQFGHGYGEENDYSLRVEKAGLKNILCDNAYVAHVGNESFGDLGLKPNAESMHRLLQKHPEYISIIDDYIKSDPLASIRNEIKQIIKKHER